MSLALEFFWKEYRAQRKLLIAYFALVLPSLILFFSFWRAESEYSKSTIAIAAFAAAGVFPATCRVPAWLTSFERTSPRDDLFVQRLPGMLATSFLGKLAFLAATSIGLPLLSVLAGCVVLRVAGIEERLQWSILEDGMAGWRVVDQAMLVVGILGLAPWTFAIGHWSSRGRMGPATALLLCSSACSLAGLSFYVWPELAQTLSRTPWPWLLWPSGTLAAFICLVRNRTTVATATGDTKLASSPRRAIRIPLERILTLMFLPIIGSIALAIVVAETGICANSVPWLSYGARTSSQDRIVAFAVTATALTPWVWAASLWTARARASVPVTVLLALVVYQASIALIDRSPHGLVERLRSWHWLWIVWLSGALVAHASFVVGRRGGTRASSARSGLLATSALVSALFCWLGFRVWCNPGPDPQRLQELSVEHCGPSGRRVLVFGRDIAPYRHRLPYLLDLESGVCTPITSIPWCISYQHLRPPMKSMPTQSRFVGLSHGESALLVDLEEGAFVDIGPHGGELRSFPQIEKAVDDDFRLHSPLAAPGYRHVWIEGTSLMLENREGVVETSPFPPNQQSAKPCGHGMLLLGSTHTHQLFDLVRRKSITIPCQTNNLLYRAFASRGYWLHQHNEVTGYYRMYAYDTQSGTCSGPLFSGRALGLFGEAEVLIERYDTDWPLWTLDVASQRFRRIDLPGVEWMQGFATRVDGEDIVVTTSGTPDGHAGQFRIRTSTRLVTAEPYTSHRVFYTDGTRELRVSDLGDQIIETNRETGRQRVLYPRSEH
ncbi:MAG: hypothetical protein KDC95_10700 [Planctomycetes bacterium]|nr:hypothetical protein [Planctomycetota bacterium]